MSPSWYFPTPCGHCVAAVCLVALTQFILQPSVSKPWTFPVQLLSWLAKNCTQGTAPDRTRCLILPDSDLHSCITSILIYYKNSKQNHLIWSGLICFGMSALCEDVILVFWLFWTVAGWKLYRTIVCLCSCSLVQAMQDVQYLYSHELDMLYLVGKTGRDSHSGSRTEIFLPLSTVSEITPAWIQKVQDTLCSDQDKKG